jgi:3-oxoacyl-[acyl-carrier-protein] synthase-3
MLQTGRHFRFSITGLASLVGRTVSMDDWASDFKIPNRKKSDTFLTGSDVQRIVGPIMHKSWDPELFRDFDCIVKVAKDAVQSAQLRLDEIDAVMLASSTPYEVQLDSDAFRMLRALHIADHVPPIQLAAGCAGMARALAVASQLAARNILVVTYEISSLYMTSPIYKCNSSHEYADHLWVSPAIFSDGAAAIVLHRDESARGYSTYSRDSLAFGDEPGFEDSLIHYPGGGGLHPPGSPGCDELSCYAMNGAQTRRYYSKGMMLNHEDLLLHRPHYPDEVRRIYTHQASPRLVDEFISNLAATANIAREKCSTNAREYGNLVIPSTLRMIDEDLTSGKLNSGDEVAVLVVGAGPERGAFLIRID